MSRRLWVSRIAIVVIIAAGVLVFDYYRASSPVLSGTWRLMLDEPFEGDTLNADLWHTCYWWADEGCTNEGNDELQWYQPDDVLVGDGLLRLRAQQRRVEGYDYTSGMIASHPAFYFRYGYLEVRAKVPRGRGLWPAIWMLPEPDYGSKPEIDVLEVIGQAPDIIDMSLHYRNEEGDERRIYGVYQGPDFSAGYHTFAVLWEPDSVTWYVDGVERYAVREFVPGVPLHLIVNLAVGGVMADAPDADTPFPSQFEVDYIRVWQRPEHVEDWTSIVADD